MKEIDLPVGFGMALIQNERAMKKFESLSETEKEEIIKKTHNFESKREMHEYVEKLANGADI